MARARWRRRWERVRCRDLSDLAIRKQIQKIAVDANLFDLSLADYPYAEQCSLKRKELQAAIEVIEHRLESLQQPALLAV